MHRKQREKRCSVPSGSIPRQQHKTYFVGPCDLEKIAEELI